MAKGEMMDKIKVMVVTHPDDKVNYPRLKSGVSGFPEDITSVVLHRLEIG